MKKMLFIIPWSQYYVGLRNFDFSQAPERAPEGVVALATFLKSHGADVEIADMLCLLVECQGNTEKALSVLFEKCRSFKPDIIGFSFFTARLSPAAYIFTSLKDFYSTLSSPLPVFIAGGAHATLLLKTTFRQIPFDALSIGEGEYSLLQLLKGEEISEIDGMITPDGAITYPKDIIKNLDELPITDWSLINKSFYAQPCHQISAGRLDAVMPITFGRGCMYRCNFCAHASFLKSRCHSAEYFVRMMDSYAAQCNVNTFIIQDSSSGSFKDEWLKVCHILTERGTPYKWWANLRANQVDRKFLQAMKDAGCIKLFFGFESGSQRVLDRMNKRITIDQCREAAKLCHELDIPFYASFIINYFYEEDSDLELTEQLILELKPTSVAINIFSPIPGSKDFDTHIERILPTLNSLEDWTKLGMLCSGLKWGNMSEGRLMYWNNRLKKLRRKINSNENSC